MELQQSTAAAALQSPSPPPPPPAFARSGYHSNGMSGSAKRRYHRRHHCFSDKNIVDLCRLDNSSNSHARSSSSSNSNNNRKNSSESAVGRGVFVTHSCQTPARQQQHASAHGSSPALLTSCCHVPRCSPAKRMSSFSSWGCEPPTKILDFIFIGGVRDATNAEFLRRENVVTILNVSREEYWSVDRGIVIHPFVVDDTSDANIQQFFRSTYMLLEQTRKAYYDASKGGTGVGPRVLVHCQRGKSRSATIVLAYLIRRNGWTVAEALQYVTRRRPSVEPNLGFIDALRAYQESMDVEERTRRCSSLGLAVRNLSRDTASSVVHKFFEDHVGCVQEVVMHSFRRNQHRRTTNGEGDSDDADINTLCLVFFAASECVRLAKVLYMQRPEIFNALSVAAGKELRLTIPSKLIRPPRAAPASGDGGNDTLGENSTPPEETPNGGTEDGAGE
ncbi:dual-specificity protein phosphatase [Trypanosoma rangeli]|uniref:protein-tyrosine-phosphatase n=1 Tax=Trypanosoma rangeli TaxID=5698 RepID=A0A3R7KSJ6_TRYRA|nr:dual-specificity protein phosphatase [Trypanosoma rangeli]RNF08842.1 dual-specificity protein phosphatase [Trypanosoma rangeli]|eukprot:RNF08842.1 dual-specificity protein phosphatase [Trypanosoma rangeli]